MLQKITSHKFLNQKNYFSNRIIQIITVSDGLFWSGNAAMTILVAIYLKEKIAVDPLQTIAIGYSIYMLAKSAFQIPIAWFLDKKPTFIDETFALFISAAIMSTAFLMYQWITEPWHLYAIQTLAGLAASINLPAWRKTFARFVDHGHEAMEYSIYDIIFNIIVATVVWLGGFIVSKTASFELLFISAAFFTFMGGVVSLILMRQPLIQHKESQS